MSPDKVPFVALFLAVLLIASACGSDGSSTVTTGDSASQPADDDGYEPTDPVEGDDGLPEGPIPVEPDGGIGDGAEPLPGAEEPAEEGTWHGAEVAETNCPGMTFKRVQASAFSFSVPTDFVDQAPQGIDSEVGEWANDAGISVGYDFGWYSYNVSEAPGAELEAVDYSGVLGSRAVMRSDNGENFVGVYFGEVSEEGGEWNKLELTVRHRDPADEIIGRCIVRSIEW